MITATLEPKLLLRVGVGARISMFDIVRIGFCSKHMSVQLVDVKKEEEQT